MNWEPIVTADAPQPAGTYSQAIRANGFIFISGQTLRTLDGQRLTSAPFEQQARLALDNLEATANGRSLRDAVKVDVFLKDMSDRAVFDRIYATYVGTPPPARALVQSNFTEFDVEIGAVLANRM